MKAENANPQYWTDRDGTTTERKEKAPIDVGKAKAGDDQRTVTHLSVIPNVESADLQGPLLKQPAQPGDLSMRAQNVLKILSVELTGEDPPRGRWVPSDVLLQRLTYQHLSTARNCGPQTTAEIVQWAQARGTSISRSFQAGKSLSAMWHEIVAKVSRGEISKKEVAEALEKSARRRNTRIPVAFQRMLLRLVDTSND
jgi:hypothetical protein